MSTNTVTKNQRYKTKLVFSVSYPLIILFNIILLSNQFSLLIEATTAFVFNLSFILHNYRGTKGNTQWIIRNLILIFIIIMFGFGLLFIETPLDFLFTGSLKIGWVVGLFIATYIAIQFSIKNLGRNNIWHFTNVTASEQNSNSIIRKWAFGMTIFTVIFLFLTQKYIQNSGLVVFTLTILSLFISSSVLSNHHFESKLIHIYSKKETKARFFMTGVIMCIVSISMFWWSSLNFLAIVTLFIGLACVVYATMEKLPFRKYILSTAIPSLVLAILFQVISSLHNNTQLNLLFSNTQNGNIGKTLIFQKKMIETRVENLYNSMKQKGELSEYINPKFDIKVVRQPSIWRKPQLNLELKYGYELVAPSFRDSVNYYSKGQYKLRRNNVAYAIARSFEISVEEYLKEYFQLDRKIHISLRGTADKLPIKSHIEYDGRYDKWLIDEVPLKYNCNEKERRFKAHESNPVTNNCELAVLRALSVRDYISKNVEILNTGYAPNYFYEAFHNTENSGGQFRKVSIKMTIFNVVPKNN